MSRFTANILANLLGQSWSVLVSIAVIPLYIKFLGIEAYGLLGFYMMLQGILQVLDLGLSPTMNRELARYSTMPDKAGEARDLVRTLEVGYWLLGIIIGGVVMGAAPFFAHHWLNVGALPPEVVQEALLLMGVLVALQWPQSFYGSGLMGLQKQVLVNSVGIPMSAVGSGGAVFILWLISPTITALLRWQILVSVIQVSLVTFLLWRSLPSSGRPARFSVDLVRNVWRFAAGMSGLTLTGIILTQLDKVILSRMLTLEMFGYYSLAGAVGRGLYVVITPIFNSVFPRLSALVAAGDISGLKNLYHLGSQLMAVFVVPLAATVALFSYDFLLLWTGSIETASNAAPIASMLVIGTGLNGLMNIPFALQLAYGWTRIGLYINAVFILTLVPVIVLMTTHYGAVGGASVWVLLNGVYLLVGIPLTHTRLLQGEARRCFQMDIGFPCVAAISVALVDRWLIVSPMPPMLTFLSLSTALLTTLIAAILATHDLRTRLAGQLSQIALGIHKRYKHKFES